MYRYVYLAENNTLGRSGGGDERLKCESDNSIKLGTIKRVFQLHDKASPHHKKYANIIVLLLLLIESILFGF